MRTLKKTLCLVLALVMMLGLCAVSASATNFTDDAKITDDYREALEIISALGIINGKDDGSYYDPQGTLTRVEGCYIISRVVKGDVGTKASSRFKDVPAGTEAAVVDFMWSSGYADGYDDTTFGPNDIMLGSHFAKWLLTVLGYEAEAEGLTGDTFDGAVRLLTARNGLTKGIANYDQDAPITREAAAHMALNALKADMMHYPNKVTVNTDGTNVTIYGTAAQVTSSNVTDYAGRNNTVVQLCENYWPDLRCESGTNDPDPGMLNTPAENIWTYNGDELYRTYARPVVTYTAGANATTVSGDLSSYYIVKNGADEKVAANRMYVNNATTYDDDKSAETEDIITVNGAAADDLSTTDKVTVGTALTLDGTDGSTLANAIASLTKNGRVVEIYATDDQNPKKITDIVVTCYTVAKVDSITTSGAKTTYKFVKAQSDGDVDLTAETFSDAPKDSTLFTNDTLAKGDIVTITSATSNAALEDAATLCVYLAEKHTGVQTNFDLKGNVTIDGKTYKVAEGVSKDAGDATALLTSDGDFDKNSNDEAEYYLDQFGYLVYSKSIATTKNYAFIVSATGEARQGLDDSKPDITVRAVLVEGNNATVGTYKVKVEKKSADDLEAKHDYLYYPNSTDGLYDKEDSTAGTIKGVAADKNVWVIANTAIVVGKVDDTITGWGTTGMTTANAAQILMSDAYGYVYTYTLKDGELTLTPLENAYTDISETDKNTTYAGQTDTQIVSGKRNYTTAAEAIVSGGAYGKPVANPGLVDPTSDAELVINASTPVVIFNADKNTAEVKTGVSGLPIATKANTSGVGYFAADGTGNTQLNAKIVFISTEKGINVSTGDRTIVYVSTSNYTTNGSGNDIVHTYDAWDQDGNVLKVHDGGDEPDCDDVSEAPGLYKVDADGLIVEKLWVAADDHAGEITGDAPYYYLDAVEDPETQSHISNDMIDTDSDVAEITGTHSWDVTGANTVIVKNGGNRNTDALFIVFETTSGGDLTGSIKTIFVV